MKATTLTLVTDLGRMDLLGEPSGAPSYAELKAIATTFDIDGRTVHVASIIDDLISMKLAAGRPQRPRPRRRARNHQASASRRAPDRRNLKGLSLGFGEKDYSASNGRVCRLLKLSICFLIAAVSSTVLAEDVNIARIAKATASESYGDMAPEKGIERNRAHPLVGDSRTQHRRLVRTVVGEAPDRGEVVVRQYDRFTFTWDLQLWQNGAWKTVGHYGQMGTKLPKIVLMRIQPAVETTKIRIANITNGPSFTEVEVYANPNQHPRTLAAASDLRGNFVGILTDSLGAEPVANATITISGKSPAGAWSQRASTDAHGIFFAHPSRHDRSDRNVRRRGQATTERRHRFSAERVGEDADEVAPQVRCGRERAGGVGWGLRTLRPP